MNEKNRADRTSTRRSLVARKQKEIAMNCRKAIVMIAALCLVVWAVQLGAQDTSWEDLDKQAKQAKIDEVAKESLDEVMKGSEAAKELFNNSYGWAAFDNLKIAWGFSGGGGNGVAVNKKTSARTYMKVGTVGVGLGLGAQKYQVVFLFQDEKTFNNFVEKGWQADATAQATAGTAGVGGQTGFVNGVAIYQLTDKGLMASADIAGTKYWKNKKLNN
jgi:lipid-binding SYLF domain-containing protein